MLRAWDMDQHLTLLDLCILIYSIECIIADSHSTIDLFPGLNVAAYYVFLYVKFMPLCPIDVYV
jgi:hypothetical protein